MVIWSRVGVYSGNRALAWVVFASSHLSGHLPSEKKHQRRQWAGENTRARWFRVPRQGVIKASVCDVVIQIFLDITFTRGAGVLSISPSSNTPVESRSSSYPNHCPFIVLDPDHDYGCEGINQSGVEVQHNYSRSEGDWSLN
ncbi:hypothetical protein FA15DRAFT_373590 [Coprinopsis marcescibilis]|uniref:Uncharacterized protein n=1 Tax=Coprinopsis marcescibilis TaxID=230819 RepID=A0A5C3KX88_COPMA|nr:hypothetical protein FA15DRAFT_373590 [Coprinopsis marcescibilis]